MGTNVKTVAYIGWVGRHNVGDEACFLAIRELLKGTCEFIPIDSAPWSRKKYPDLCILGGGTLLDIRYGRREKQILFPMSANNVPIVIWGSGVVDLYGKTMHPKVLRLLNYAKYVGVRGPISQKILAARGFKNANIIGDPALLLEQKESPIGNPHGLMLADIIPSVAINVGHTNNNLYGTEKHVEEQCRKLIINLHKRKYAVSLFSVWPKDNQMINRIADNLPKGVGIFTQGMRKLQSDEDIYSMMKFLQRHDCLIGMKLHSCVLAAAANVPFISLAYRKKCIDFMQSVGFKDWYFKTDTNWADRVPDKVEKLLKNREEFCNKVKEKKEEYRTKHEALARYVTTLLQTGQ